MRKRAFGVGWRPEVLQFCLVRHRRPTTAVSNVSQVQPPGPNASDSPMLHHYALAVGGYPIWQLSNSFWCIYMLQMRHRATHSEKNRHVADSAVQLVSSLPNA